MAGQIMERIAVQSAEGASQTMKLVYPTKGSPTYIYLGAGAYDVIVTWGGAASLTLHHRWDGSTGSQRNHPVILEADSSRSGVMERRGMVRVGSEHGGQSLFLTTSGALDSTARATVQIIPVDFTVDFEVTTS